jgi:hypothetical protein
MRITSGSCSTFGKNVGINVQLQEGAILKTATAHAIR